MISSFEGPQSPPTPAPTKINGSLTIISIPGSGSQSVLAQGGQGVAGRIIARVVARTASCKGAAGRVSSV